MRTHRDWRWQRKNPLTGGAYDTKDFYFIRYGAIKIQIADGSPVDAVLFLKRDGVPQREQVASLGSVVSMAETDENFSDIGR